MSRRGYKFNFWNDMMLLLFVKYPSKYTNITQRMYSLYYKFNNQNRNSMSYFNRFDRTHQHVMYRSFRFHVEDIYKKRTTSFTEYHVNYREVSIRSFLYIAIYLKNSLKIFFHLWCDSKYPFYCCKGRNLTVLTHERKCYFKSWTAS